MLGADAGIRGQLAGGREYEAEARAGQTAPTGVEPFQQTGQHRCAQEHTQLQGGLAALRKDLKQGFCGGATGRKGEPGAQDQSFTQVPGNPDAEKADSKHPWD